MTHTHENPSAPYVRPAAFTASWLALAALATGVFFAPRGDASRPTIDDMVGFGGSIAISGAAATISEFGIGGRRRWAVEMVLCVLVLGATAALLLLYFLRFDPSVLRARMDLWSFLRLRDGAGSWAQQLAGYHVPLGTAVGNALGAVAGLLIRLGRRHPRLATGTALAILFAFASGSFQKYSPVTWAGRMRRYHVLPWSLSDDQISITGVIFGAIAGSAAAGMAMYATRQVDPAE